MDKIKYTLNDFTFGFELEGAFDMLFIEGMRLNAGNDNISIDTKNDGSVNINRRPSDTAYDEVNVGVFRTFDKMIEYLECFKGDKYRQNESCGLHLHIKGKRRVGEKKWGALKGIILDWQFMKKLQSYAYNELCEHVKKRIFHNSFCSPHFTFNSFMTNIKRREKYRFMKNHERGTLEFRFFSTCPHKVENVSKFLKFFIKELNKLKVGGSYEKKMPKKKIVADIEINI